MRLPLPYRFAAFLTGLLSAVGTARGLTVARGTATSAEGFRSSLAVVSGYPAVVWTTYPVTAVRYARATDAEGTAWGPATTLYDAPDGADYGTLNTIGLREVNGNPAVCYRAVKEHELRYQRATDATGTGEWNAPVVISTGFQVNASSALGVVDGNPAIVFAVGPNMKYVRALDADGTAWGTPQTIDAEGSFAPTLTIYQDRPAVAYSGSAGLVYLYASDAAGTAWNPRVLVSPYPDDLGGPSMQVVNGRPFIAGTRSQQSNLSYARAANAGSTAWTALVPLPGTTGQSYSPSLAVVGGKPALCYFSYSLDSTLNDLKYMEAQDAGGTQWKTPVTLERDGTVGENPCLLEISGRPALTYFDSSRRSLKYLRATATGWPPELRVLQPGATPVQRGETRDFGPVAPGSKGPLQFTLKNMNPGSADLIVQSLTIDGPDATEFIVSDPPAIIAVPAGGSTTFIVKYAPVSAGTKSAVLHILTNCESVPGPFDVLLTGATLPDISVERTGGAVLADDGNVDLPLTPLDGAVDISFTVRSKGVAPLTGLSVSIDGPDAAEFTLTAAPPSTVAGGGSTSFTVRHASHVAGSKLAVLHLASNLTDSRNPFDISVRVAPAAVDASFSPLIFGGEIQALAVTAGDKILAATAGSSVVRLNADGTPDVTFFAPALENGTVLSLLALTDGKILMGGRFTSVNGRPRPGLARLETDGSLDESFVPACPDGGVVSLAVQRDGKFLAGGALDGFGGGQPFLVRLQPDGALDPSFTTYPRGGGTSGVYGLALQPDGRIIACGVFDSAVEPTSVLTRLDPDGTPHGLGAINSNTGLRCLALQADGKVVAGGYITGGVIRLLPDGTLDSFPEFPPFDYVSALAVQTDGACLAGVTFFPAPQLLRPPARVRPDGVLESGFIPDAVKSGRRVALQSSGKVLVGGDIALAGGGRAALARLTNAPAFTSLETAGRSTVRWRRSGTAPEVTDAVFHMQPAGAAEWTLLGFAARIPGGWELSGLALPSSGLLRAQGRAGESLIESVVPLLPPLEAWRTRYFQTAASTGNAADDADPDHDGLTNFAEFAFGSSPVDRAGNGPPELNADGAGYRFSFTAPEGREDVDYRAEWSASMAPGTWTEIVDEGTAPQHVFRAPAGAARAYVRMKVALR